jgi:ATP/maltotriose-dependent transcriptional regulator MalT
MADADHDQVAGAAARRSGHGESLTPREAGVLALAARGLTNAEIGRELFISEATVKTHLLRTFAKLGMSGRTAAVARAIEIGLLPPGGPA